MDRLKEMLRKNQTVYFVVMAVFVVGAIFTISFSGQIAQWLTLALLTIICLLATSLTIVFAMVMKDKYKTNIEQAVSSQLEQLMLVKDELQQMQHQLQAEQVKHVQLLESKLNNIEEIQVSKMKELQQSLELNKQLAVTKITEQMTE